MTRKPEPAAVTGASDLVNMFAGATGFGTDYWRGLGRIGEANAEFFARRLSHNAKTVDALLRCKSMDDMIALQRQWIETAVDEYGEHAGRLIETGRETAAQSVEPETALESVKSISSAA